MICPHIRIPYCHLYDLHLMHPWGEWFDHQFLMLLQAQTGKAQVSLGLEFILPNSYEPLVWLVFKSYDSSHSHPQADCYVLQYFAYICCLHHFPPKVIEKTIIKQWPRASWSGEVPWRILHLGFDHCGDIVIWPRPGDAGTQSETSSNVGGLIPIISGEIGDGLWSLWCDLPHFSQPDLLLKNLMFPTKMKPDFTAWAG